MSNAVRSQSGHKGATRSIPCTIPRNAKLHFGSGGSQAIIVITNEPRGPRVFKFMPVLLRQHEGEIIKKSIQRGFEMEIHILKLLTANFAKNTPHIVNILGSKYCDTIPLALFDKCPTITNYLNTKHTPPQICRYLLDGAPTIVGKGLYVIELEYCKDTLSAMLTRLAKPPVDGLKEFLDRIVFQMMYTLETIKAKFPHFVHGDLFVRNILVTYKMTPAKGYTRYNIHDQKYDLPYKGLYIKMNDFGLTQIDKNTSKKFSSRYDVINDPYCDVFNFMFDMYDGQNLGASSLMSLTKNTATKRFLDAYFSMAMDIPRIKRVFNLGHRDDLVRNWGITGDKGFVTFFKLKTSAEILKIVGREFPYDSDHTIVEEYFWK